MDNAVLETIQEKLEREDEGLTSSLPNDTQVKSLLRILRSLSDDLTREEPSFNTPNTWILRDLIKHHYCCAGDKKWHETLCWTLTNIAMRTNPRSSHREALILATNIPCEMSEIHEYAITMLDYLASQTLHH